MYMFIVQISPYALQAVVCTNSIGIPSLTVTARWKASNKISAFGVPPSGISAGQEKVVWNGKFA